MDLKKFRKSVTALTLGMFLVANLGMSVFVKASDDGQKLPETTEKVENLTVTVPEENNNDSSEITEITEIEEKKDSITEENTNKSEIIEIDEIIEDKKTTKSKEIPIGSKQITPGSAKLDEYHQGVVASYLDADTLTKMEQVNKKTADGTSG